MKLAVVGARDFTDREMVQTWVAQNHSRFSALVTGDARGVDTWAVEAWRKATDKPYKIYKADWNRYGNFAGMKRNVDIIGDADFIAAFWAPDLKKDKDHSNGTFDDVALVFASAKPMNLYYRAS